MNEDEIRRHAAAAGLAAEWRDVTGHIRHVPAIVLRDILDALGTPPDRAQAPLVTGDAGQPVTLPGRPGPCRILHEDGTARDAWAEAARDGHVTLPVIDTPGYHRLELADRAVTLAIAPPRCWTVMDATGGRRAWGLAVQLYALRRAGDGGLGDFAALETLARRAAAHGAAAIAISPVHAQFSADPDRFSPYAPSSRGMLNVLHAAVPLPADAERAALEAAELVDWPRAGRLRLAALRSLFATATATPTPLRDAFDAFRAAGGEALERHARFEALHQAQFHGPERLWNWRDWPAGLRDPASPAVARFAADHAQDVALHAFAQFLADRGLRQAQAAARAGGMPIGLIADVAVGADPGGSDAWRRPDEMLRGLTIGAPPDAFNPAGQNWGVTTYAPHGLVAGGFGAFLEMLRAALRHAGGLRIDHVMGLARLWVIPAHGAEGAYLHFPRDDLLRLVKLESWRHRAIVLGEDLGTLPDGFRDMLERDGLAGMRVLWFERDGDRFLPPAHWSPDAVAMTSTHDLPSVAGWWSGHDLDWQARLGRPEIAAAQAARAHDRTALWAALRESGATGADQPPPDAPAPAVAAAAAHIGRAACALALLPVEDALALPDQPNIPGTLDEHPNWRRRLPLPAETMLDTEAVAARLEGLARGRQV